MDGNVGNGHWNGFTGILKKGILFVTDTIGTVIWKWVKRSLIMYPYIIIYWKAVCCVRDGLHKNQSEVKLLSVQGRSDFSIRLISSESQVPGTLPADVDLTPHTPASLAQSRFRTISHQILLFRVTCKWPRKTQNLPRSGNCTECFSAYRQ